MSTPTQILSSVFGFSGFRPGQQEIVDAVLAKDDVLAILPTGAGKSLCFQLPALMREGVTIVISPLIALMRDQVASLQQAGVAAGALTSLNTEEETEDPFAVEENKFLGDNPDPEIGDDEGYGKLRVFIIKKSRHFRKSIYPGISFKF